MTDQGPDFELGYDPLETIRSAKAVRRDPRTLPRLLRQGLSLAFEAGRGPLTLTLLLQTLGAVLGGLQVLIAERALRAVLAADRAGGVGGVLLPLSVLVALSALLSASTTLLAQRQRYLGELVSRLLWAKILRVASRAPLSLFESTAFYDRLQVVRTHALTRPLALAQALVGILGGGAGLLVVGFALLRIEPLLVPLLALAGVPLLLLNRRGSRLEFTFALQQTPPFRVREYLQRLLMGRQEAKEIRAYGLSSVLTERQDALYGRYVDDLSRHVRHRTLLLLIGALATALLTAITLGLMLALIAAGRLGFAQAGAAVVAVRLLSTRLEQVTSGLGALFESSLFLRDLGEFLETPLEPAEPADGSAPLRPFRRLSLRHVSFTYPGGNQPAVNGVDLELDRGQFVAVVGRNGSGKSTLAKIAAGLYLPDEGAVCWDGIDFSDLPRDRLRRSVSVVFQDFVKFQLSARDNVGAGRVEAMQDLEAIRRAGQRADVDAVLDALPDGYATVLSKEFPGGQDLSGGQWQRVAIARGFYRDAPFLILDEPSASLDPLAEQQLFRQLRTLFQGRTVLVISHRFSTVRGADRILVMRDGAVVEDGDHPTLMRLDGEYRRMYRAQVSGYAGKRPRGVT